MLEEQNSRFPFRDDGSGAPCLPVLCDRGHLNLALNFHLPRWGVVLELYFDVEEDLHQYLRCISMSKQV